jgi:anti-sigma B factor antagonist
VDEHDDLRDGSWPLPPEFAIESITAGDGELVVSVAGELDLYTAPRLERALLEADGASRTTVDLSRTTFVDSTALHVLLVAARRLDAAGAPFVVLAPDPNVRRVFVLTGLDRVLTVAADAGPGARACPG